MSLPFHFKMSLYELINYLLTNDRESEVYSLMFSFYLPFISLLTVGDPLTSYDVTNSPTKYILFMFYSRLFDFLITVSTIPKMHNNKTQMYQCFFLIICIFAHFHSLHQYFIMVITSRCSMTSDDIIL